MNSINLIVVGGGHAGAEAALAAARMGVETLLITSRKDAIARMPCNPSIGGLAKSHLVYELDALGGEMGRNADLTALQAKTLNLSRGPAVRATRTQCAKREYTERMQQVVASQPHLHVLEDAVIRLITNDLHTHYQAVETENNGFIYSQAIVITSGTALKGRTWIGKKSTESGGDGRPAVNQLSDSLSELGFKLIRLKTGTPPRLAAESCDFSACQRQDGENPRPLFHVEHGNTAFGCLGSGVFGCLGSEVFGLGCLDLSKHPDNNCSTWNNQNNPNTQTSKHPNTQQPKHQFTGVPLLVNAYKPGNTRNYPFKSRSVCVIWWCN